MGIGSSTSGDHSQTGVAGADGIVMSYIERGRGLSTLVGGRLPYWCSDRCVGSSTKQTRGEAFPC